MRYVKLCISVFVAGAVLLLGWWCWYTVQRVDKLEAQFEAHKEHTAYALAQGKKVAELNTLRQTHLENIVLHSQEILMAIQQIDRYNARIPVRYAKGKRPLTRALGGQ
jgi:hypothetical protein